MRTSQSGCICDKDNNYDTDNDTSNMTELQIILRHFASVERHCCNVSISSVVCCNYFIVSGVVVPIHGAGSLLHIFLRLIPISIFIMSGIKAEEVDDNSVMTHCANCGIGEGEDGNKLKICNGCNSVRYCSIKCQKEHRPYHKKVCKQRAAELRDELLFKQPESTHLGDCPICYLPLPIDRKNLIIMSCCCKFLCRGCHRANMRREVEGQLNRTCLFCRSKSNLSEEECKRNLRKRVQLNDPNAMFRLGHTYKENGDHQSVFAYLSKAAALGNVDSHHDLAYMYHLGQGVERDEKKEAYHLEQACIGGHPEARHNLGCVERQNKRFERALKHFMIASKQGYDESLGCVKDLYADGFASKEDYVSALRGYQAAVDAEKSEQREEAERAYLGSTNN